MKTSYRKKMQLTIEQCVFVGINYHERKSLQQVKERFSRRFPGRNAPGQDNIEKCQEVFRKWNKFKLELRKLWTSKNCQESKQYQPCIFFLLFSLVIGLSRCFRNSNHVASKLFFSKSLNLIFLVRKQKCKAFKRFLNELIFHFSSSRKSVFNTMQ